MYQLVTLVLVDLILPSREKDTPLRWAARIALIMVVALITSLVI